MTPSKIAPRPPAERERETEEARAEIIRLAQAQGVKPIANIDDLRGDFWSESELESSEDFGAWLRALRKESLQGDASE